MSSWADDPTDGVYTYLWLREFISLRDSVYTDLPELSLDPAEPDRASIHEIASDDTTYRINPRSVQYPELLKREYNL